MCNPGRAHRMDRLGVLGLTVASPITTCRIRIANVDTR